MDKCMRLKLLVALLLTTLSLNAADTVTNGQAVARSRMVQSLQSASDVSIAITPAATNITYAWEIWNLGTNAISITNGIAGTNVTLAASAVVGLRATDTNAWRIIYRQP